MKILIDAQMPPALARWLREQSHEALAVREVGLREAEDGAIWDYARQTGAVILTKDEDFATRALQQPDGPVIVWLRVKPCLGSISLSCHSCVSWGVLSVFSPRIARMFTDKGLIPIRVYPRHPRGSPPFPSC